MCGRFTLSASATSRAQPADLADLLSWSPYAFALPLGLAALRFAQYAFIRRLTA